ncbi:ABC transporter substrate-binding protein [Pseudoduganella namucuonensis]|uniref:Putative ABC transport system substrate-binding protein n=1 Tax=Pseudoduganella namucuonensis TaxID=1035707 RepID=A0A1I7L4S9_9BURK|nr:ABC transporter substrate-binding protein [Pseudoduganella namucuonensis]SFV04655.1 putative ABC transport system substrate-binding protein [Pseudoduganella namucuonensis]
MKRRAFTKAGLAGVAGALACALPPAAAQARPYRIYMILFRGETAVEHGFRDYFAVHGIPVELIVRDVALDVGKVPELVAEARAMKVDLIYTWGTPVTLAVVGKEGAVDPSRHVTDIPVVFTMVASPVGAGLVKSLASPAGPGQAKSPASSGRNLTGASHVVPASQQFSAIRAYRRFDRIAIIYNPAEPNSVQNVKDLRALAATERFQLIERPVPLDDKGQPIASALPGMVAELSSLAVQLLYIGPDSFLGANRKALTEAALLRRLPTFSATEIPLREGKALFGLVSGYENVGRLTAFKAEQILRGKVKPAAIPIETLARFSYLVNMSVAAQLDLYPPLKVINYAEVLK